MSAARICVFCGARAGHNPAFAALARRTGRLLAEAGHTLVYGGGGVGLMGALADGALEAGGAVIGVIPTRLIELEQAHPRVRDMRIVKTMLERKTVMMESADAFLTLPGGIGTLDEVFEVLTANQLQFHAGRCAIVNHAEFFTPLLTMLGAMVQDGFWFDEARSRLIVESTPERALAALAPG